jgi:hypothetical protein
MLRNDVKRMLRELRWPRLAGRHFDAAVIAALAFGWHPSRFSSGLRASRCCGQFCDRPSLKQTVAMATAICGAKVSSGQCFRGFAARTWRENAHGRRPKLGAWSCGRADRDRRRGAERAHWRELQKGGRGELAVWAASWAAARKLTQIGELLLGKLHRNVGIPGWYARSGIHRNAGATCWTAAVPMIFAGWAARFVAARWTGRALRTGALREKPAGRAGLGFLPSTAREFAKRRAEQDGKTQRGRGFWG